jgi:hypothetical protein
MFFTFLSSAAWCTTVVKSAGPKMSQTACTWSGWPSLPPMDAKAFLPPEVPTSADRCPPADAPTTATRWGSKLYFSLCARNQRIAA